MFEYREKATTDGEEPRIPDNRASSRSLRPAYMNLAAQYGLDDDMIIGSPGGDRQHTVQEEYQAYMTAPCSPTDVAPLKFWEVGGESDINGVN